MDKVVLLGAGGYCAGVVDSIVSGNLYEIVGITDPVDKKEHCGIPVIGTDDRLQEIYDSGVRCAHITVGSIARPTVRKRLVALSKAVGFKLVTVIDPTAIVSKFATIGEMVYVGKAAIVNATATVGNYCMINTGCIVEHGCNVGDWVHVAPGATLAADITIGNSSHIGVNATVLQGINIGSDVVVGAGSTVIRDVEAGKVVVGVVK